MKMKTRSKKIIGILLIAFLVITTKVYAASDKFETTLKASSSNVKREATVTITIGLDKISVEGGDKGIGGYTGKVRFDSSVLEYVSTAGTDNWEKPTYQDGLITATTSGGEVAKTTQNIATITFKVKKDAKLGESTISLENFSGTNAKDDISAENKSVKITVVDQNGNSSDSGNNGNSGTNSGSNNNQNTSGNKNDQLNVIDTTKKDTSTKKGSLPKTGNSNIILLTAIGGCTLLAIVTYARMRLLDKK